MLIIKNVFNFVSVCFAFSCIAEFSLSFILFLIKRLTQENDEDTKKVSA